MNIKGVSVQREHLRYLSFYFCVCGMTDKIPTMQAVFSNIRSQNNGISVYEVWMSVIFGGILLSSVMQVLRKSNICELNLTCSSTTNCQMVTCSQLFEQMKHCLMTELLSADGHSKFFVLV